MVLVLERTALLTNWCLFHERHVGRVVHRDLDRARLRTGFERLDVRGGKRFEISDGHVEVILILGDVAAEFHLQLDEALPELLDSRPVVVTQLVAGAAEVPAPLVPRSAFESVEGRAVNRVHGVVHIASGDQIGHPRRQPLFSLVACVSHVLVDVEVREEWAVAVGVLDDPDRGVERSDSAFEGGRVGGRRPVDEGVGGGDRLVRLPLDGWCSCGCEVVRHERQRTGGRSGTSVGEVSPLGRRPPSRAGGSHRCLARWSARGV